MKHCIKIINIIYLDLRLECPRFIVLRIRNISFPCFHKLYDSDPIFILNCLQCQRIIAVLALFHVLLGLSKRRRNFEKFFILFRQGLSKRRLNFEKFFHKRCTRLDSMGLVLGFRARFEHKMNHRVPDLEPDFIFFLLWVAKTWNLVFRE